MLGYDLWHLVQNGPAEKLNKTIVTQPAMLAAGVATWRLWQKLGGALPVAMAGHSLGEYTALVCAGSKSSGRCPDPNLLPALQSSLMRTFMAQLVVRWLPPL